MTSVEPEAHVAAQTATTPPGRNQNSSLKDLPMTQQPDPFSELRGLMEKAEPVLQWIGDAETAYQIMPHGGEAKEVWWSFTGHGESDEVLEDRARLFVAMHQALPALLDERDRLIGALTLIRDQPDTHPTIGGRWIDWAKGRCKQALGARQALSQEIG